MNCPATVSEQATITAGRRAVRTASARLASARTAPPRKPRSKSSPQYTSAGTRSSQAAIGTAGSIVVTEITSSGRRSRISRRKARTSCDSRRSSRSQAAGPGVRLGQRLVVELDHPARVAEHLAHLPRPGDDDVERRPPRRARPARPPGTATGRWSSARWKTARVRSPLAAGLERSRERRRARRRRVSAAPVAVVEADAVRVALGLHRGCDSRRAGRGRRPRCGRRSPGPRTATASRTSTGPSRRAFSTCHLRST